MAAKRKRDLLDFDPNKSDSEDETFDLRAQASSPRPRAQGRSAKGRASTTAARKPTKRRKETYGDSEDDIEADSDDISDDEEASFGGGDSDEEEERVERNPRTGRGVRRVAKRRVKYEESDEEEEEEEEEEQRESSSGGEDPLQGAATSRLRRGPPAAAAAAAATRKQSLVVKLRVPAWKMERGRVTRSRTGGGRLPAKRSETPAAAPSAMGTRRSSRISHDEQEPLVALTDSGKHEQVMRAGTSTPEPQQQQQQRQQSSGSRRPTRGGKGLKKPPSAIMEASQEGSTHAEAATYGDEMLTQMAEGGEQDALVRPRTSPEAEAAKTEEDEDIQMERVDEEEQVVQESQEDADEEDAPPIIKGGRALRDRRKASTPPASQPQTGTRRGLRARKAGMEQSSDFEPDAEGEADVEENISESDDLLKPNRPGSSAAESRSGRRSGRLSRKSASQRSRSRRQQSEELEDEDLDPDEIADEAADLEEDNRRNKRPRRRAPAAARSEIAFEPNLRNRGNRPDYRILRPELLMQMEEDDAAPAGATATPRAPRRAGGGGGAYRSLFSTYGPFGGAGGPPPVFGADAQHGMATAGVDSDSSDDEAGGRGGQQGGVGGAVGMTPTSAFPKPYQAPQALNSDPIQGPGGGPAGLGKVRDKKALADADPLGVDPNVSFEGVGGLDDHIDRLKEMVALPLLYPEVFQRFHVTPPRGVLFHGPPGTGKTLLARALASSVSSHGKKVTFYMRKGADALSKWVGEAEKQLRLLFEEARKNQPSIIFFDEIDGLAPVRSSKQEQIHASIVATLLALMDGMDGRGQVIVIGATNRPDSVDPALRRPGRFDREFYFPLPDVKARRAIIDIHTNGWEPPLAPAFKDQLAELTRGYGGADLRALCTEAALNAVQGTFPQIYASEKKLIIDPAQIKVLAKDFMISVGKIVPSSERSAASGAAPLKKEVEPLLRKPLAELTGRLNEILPRKRKATALEEAMFDDREEPPEVGFEREEMLRRFEGGRVFRPRLLVHGSEGMGQGYVGRALLAKLEGVHVQNFDMATLMKDSTRSPEAAIVQLFEEAKRHKPSVIYLPNVDVWYQTLSDSAIRTFTGLLRSLPPTEAVLVLGVMDRDVADEKAMEEHEKPILRRMVQDLFNYSVYNRYLLRRPDEPARAAFFKQVVDLLNKTPSEFPQLENRKKRKLADLPVAAEPQEARQGPTREELKAQKKKDRQTLNMLKLNIGPVMEQIKLKYKKFRTPIVDDAAIGYLYDEQNPDLVTTDLTEEQRQQRQLYRPYEKAVDDKGVEGLREVATGKFYYNLEIVTIEKRLSNGYYKRPKDFLADIKRLAKDAKMAGDQDRTLKANELLANVEVDISYLEQQQPALCAECEAVYEREQERVRREREKVGADNVPRMNVPPPGASKTTTETSGPVMLGQEIPGARPPLVGGWPITPSRNFGQDLSPTMGGGAGAWSTTNGTGSGSHAHTNGSTVPSRPGGVEDSEMLDSQAELYSTSQPLPQQQQQQQQQRQQHQPQTGQGMTPSQQQRSQRSAHTQIPPGSQPDQYQNSASTTTSGQKTSDKSARSSGPYSVASQWTTNGDHPHFSMVNPGQGSGSGSDLPDTQPRDEQQQQQQQQQQLFSQPSQPPSEGGSSQGMPPPPAAPPRQTSSIQALLNNPPITTTTTKDDAPAVEASSATRPLLVPNKEENLRHLHEQLVSKSSGMSVEQLEQIHAHLMDVIWKSRGNWNRVQVWQAVARSFNETVVDIEACQKVGRPSQED